MFVYFSKLLPLFIYPLGLACLLLVMALILLWKRPRLSALSIVLALGLLLVGGNSWVANQLTRSLEWQHIPLAELPRAEAIVVLGGATRPQIYPRPAVDVMEEGDRVIYGAQLYRQGKAPIVVLSGGRTLDLEGVSASEASDMAALIELMGVPKSAILQDATSLNTYENAVNVKKILQAQNIKRVLLVTSALHMPRSLKIFRKQGIDAIAAPTDFLVSREELNASDDTLGIKLLNALPDARNLNQMTRSLKEYVGLFVYRLRGWL
ncbi:MAG TPA: YdcF family protein [Coleofasciculaceae cyanobacterium]|jgi:uncharacterized SAM-binding protein YcdF (DUF218 family)